MVAAGGRPLDPFREVGRDEAVKVSFIAVLVSKSFLTPENCRHVTAWDPRVYATAFGLLRPRMTKEWSAHHNRLG